MTPASADAQVVAAILINLYLTRGRVQVSSRVVDATEDTMVALMDRIRRESSGCTTQARR